MTSTQTLARIALAASLALVTAPAALAQERAPAPPWVMTGANTVTVAVIWDAASIAGLLPEGLEPLDDHSGGVNIYTAEGGYGLQRYSAAYAYVNVRGWASTDGSGARHVVQGYYGPDARVSEAMRDWFGSSVDPGEAVQRIEDGTWIGEGGDGDSRLTIAVAPGPEASCEPVAGALNYVSEAPDGRGFGLLRIPFSGDFCPAQTLSVTLEGPVGSIFERIEVDRAVSAWRLRDASFAFTQ